MTMASKTAISLLLKEAWLKYFSGQKPTDLHFPLRPILAPLSNFQIVPRSLWFPYGRNGLQNVAACCKVLYGFRVLQNVGKCCRVIYCGAKLNFLQNVT